MHRSLLLPAVLSLVALAAPAGAQTPVAGDLIKAAQAAAKPGNRTVLVAFHATWCPWCRRLEGTLARPAIKEVLDRHFVIQWLTIKERGDKKVLDNPGAAELYAKWTGGAQAGIPFCAVLDASGEARGTSIRALKPGDAAQNIGYPGRPEEIKAFIALLKEGAPTLTAAEEAVLAKELDAARPKG